MIPSSTTLQTSRKFEPESVIANTCSPYSHSVTTLADIPLFVVSVKKRQLTMAPLSALSANAEMQPGIPIVQEHVEASKYFVRPVADLVGKTCLALLA